MGTSTLRRCLSKQALDSLPARSMQIVVFLVLGTVGIPLLSASERRSTRPSVPTSVVSVASGGYWETKNERGRYRIIVEEGGWEHVKHRVHIEWISERSGEKRLAVVAAETVAEVGGMWAIGAPRIVLAKGATSVELPATNAHDGGQREFLLELGTPGVYRVR